MRLIQVYVPPAHESSVTDALEEMELEYLLSATAHGDDGALAQIPAPAGAVDAILEGLYDAGLPEDTYTVVQDVDRARVPNLEAITDRYVAGPKGDRGAPDAEIRERAEDLKPDTLTYVAFAAVSAIVAVGGLLLNSAIVIVGAMVIAPFAGSTLSASVGAVISDREMVVDSATSQAVGLIVGFVAAVLMSAFLQWSGFVPPTLVVSRIDQVGAFLTPNLLTLVIAVAAGFAGALALATDLPVSIAGVAVAAAIVPAVGTAGIGVAWGEPIVLLGAVVLLLMNIVFINLAAYVGLLWLGYRSSVIRSARASFGVSVRKGAYAVVVVAFLLVVAFTGVSTYQHIAFEQGVNRAVGATLDEPAYESLELVSVATEYSDLNVLGQVETVTVTVSRTTEADHPNLDDRLREWVSERTGRPVAVSVRFLDYQVSQPPPDDEPGAGHAARLLDRLEAVGSRLIRAVGATPSGRDAAAS